MLAAALRKAGIMKNWLNLRNLVFLYVVTVCVSWFTDYAANMEWSGEIFLGRVINSALSIEFVPSFMAPPQEVVQKLIAGGYPVPWGDWITPILFWWALSIIFGGLMASIAVILRRGWTDLESVPFPHTVAAYEVISNTTDLVASDKGRASRTRPFLIGVLLGGVVQFLIWAQVVFPWFPDVFGFRTNTCAHGAQYITTDSPLAGARAPLEHGCIPQPSLIARFRHWPVVVRPLGRADEAQGPPQAQALIHHDRQAHFFPPSPSTFFIASLAMVSSPMSLFNLSTSASFSLAGFLSAPDRASLPPSMNLSFQ
jgi:hypothetical protein